jgi:hypothetical protein
MATNPYFNNNKYKPTQDLMEDLMIESIKTKGMDVYYIPRRYSEKLDTIFGEDPMSSFNISFPIEMYLDTFNGFQGDNEVISKFGIEIMDNMTLTVSKKRFEQEASKLPELPDRPIDLDAPAMGDLIYFPLSKGLFEIKYVDNKQIFFQGGKLYTYKLECELFKYSMERIDTGDSDIDEIEDNIVQSIDEDGDGDIDFIRDAKNPSDNAQLQTDAASIVDFTEVDPFSEGNY